MLRKTIRKAAAKIIEFLSILIERLIRSDKANKDIIKAIRLDADMSSVGMRMYGIPRMTSFDFNWNYMSDEECQSLGIHPDNEIARFIMLVREYDKKLAETRNDAK